MKRLIALIPIALLLISGETPAQVKCTIPCWQQSFPYNFCIYSTGLPRVDCSTDPNDYSLGMPIKAFIPGCVSIFNESTIDTFWQPSEAVPDFTETPPTMPDRETIWLRYVKQCIDFPDQETWIPPYDDTYGDNPGDWSYDITAYEAATQQWDLDSSNFLAGLGWELIDMSGLDDTAQNAVNNYAHDGYGWLWEEYDHEDSVYNDQYSTYQSDSTRHFTGNDVNYVQPWNDAQAATDAQNALDNWLHTCNPPIAPDGPDCCIHIILDAVVNDWGTQGLLAKTDLPKCNEASCPDLIRFLKVNTSLSFLYQSNSQSDWHPDTSYKLHGAPFTMWYTGKGKPLPNTYESGGAYADFSFFQLMEHEIGHYLGLEHPEALSYSCPNCYTNNPYVPQFGPINPAGFWTVMAQQLNFPGDTALLLTNEDSCQFKKLYCEADVSVKLGPQPNDWFHPEVFPNPSNGGMMLTFSMVERNFTQISIYDMLGNAVREVSSDYLNEGEQSIPLGTESLPSGNYVCRVRVGDRVSYINLVISK